MFMSKQRVYLNDNNSKDNVTVIAMRINWELDKRLKKSTLIIIHHDEDETFHRRSNSESRVSWKDIQSI